MIRQPVHREILLGRSFGAGDVAQASGLRSPARCSVPDQRRINPKHSTQGWMRLQEQLTKRHPLSMTSYNCAHIVERFRNTDKVDVGRVLCL